MRITLNLATRPFADLGPALKRLRIAMAVLAALCHLFLVWACISSTARPRRRAPANTRSTAESPASRPSASTPSAMMQPPRQRAGAHQAEALNQLFDEKAFSWTLAMEAMETVLPAGVQVTSIEPIRAKDGHITVHLRVVGPRDRAVDLVAISSTPGDSFSRASWAKTPSPATAPRQRLEPISASNRFDFDLLAEYNPPTSEESASPPRRVQDASSLVPCRLRLPPTRTTLALFQHHPAIRAVKPLHGTVPACTLEPSTVARRSAMSANGTPSTLRERLASPLTWHFAGFAVLLVARHRPGRSSRPGLGRHEQPLQRGPRRQADRS